MMVVILSFVALLTKQGSLAFQGLHVYSNHKRSFLSERTLLLLLSQTNEPPEGTTNATPGDDDETRKNLGLLRLAELSLKDYDWRSSIFKSKEADRRVEESLARMMGDQPAYVRPMDASDENIGPLVSVAQLESCLLKKKYLLCVCVCVFFLLIKLYYI